VKPEVVAANVEKQLAAERRALGLPPQSGDNRLRTQTNIAQLVAWYLAPPKPKESEA
jgi:hypothetical protein